MLFSDSQLAEINPSPALFIYIPANIFPNKLTLNVPSNILRNL